MCGQVGEGVWLGGRECVARGCVARGVCPGRWLSSREVVGSARGYTPPSRPVDGQAPVKT